ncbi:MAG TPA: hypothetical protein VK904_01980, partial [Miltoncostaeaceae bacterium]|nr:hypothetical protein [Miltoncostaeaceae bacterium]
MIGRARLGLAAGVVLALAAGSPAIAAPGLLSGSPAVGRVVVQAPVAGDGAARVVLDIGTAHPAVAARARGRIDLTTAAHQGVVRVRLRAAGGRALASAGSGQPLLLDGPGGRVQMVHRIVLGASASAA